MKTKQVKQQTDNRMKWLFQRFRVIMAALMVAAAFIACDTNGDDDGGGGNPAVTADDEVSVKALVGSWFDSGASESFGWVFSADGNFATGYASNTINPDNSRTNYRYTIKGKYRVNGYNIECYNSQISSSEKLGLSMIWITSEEAAKLLTAPMDKPNKIDNFSVPFEFYDNMHLRIVYERNVNSRYDYIIPYNGTSHNVTVPTHQIPGKPWPTNLLPSGLPAYGSGGRIREVETDTYGGVIVYIDRTTSDALVSYCNRLLQAGWSFGAGGTMGNLINGYLVILNKDNVSLILDGPGEGNYTYEDVRIIYSK
jgi:hypothetical protein